MFGGGPDSLTVPKQSAPKSGLGKGRRDEEISQRDLRHGGDFRWPACGLGWVSRSGRRTFFEVTFRSIREPCSVASFARKQENEPVAGKFKIGDWVVLKSRRPNNDRGSTAKKPVTVIVRWPGGYDRPQNRR
jgi:hypothetical protein